MFITMKLSSVERSMFPYVAVIISIPRFFLSRIIVNFHKKEGFLFGGICRFKLDVI